jgi:hypothetical protein
MVFKNYLERLPLMRILPKRIHDSPSTAELDGGEAKPYKSPPRKLVHFFEKSRDQWKAKCLQAKIAVKGLNNRIRFLESSQEHWKNRAKALEAELAQIKAPEPAGEEAFKKKR